MRLERQAVAKPGGELGLYLKTNREIVKVVNQGSGDDLSVIYKITLATGQTLDYKEARVEAERPLRRPLM